MAFKSDTITICAICCERFSKGQNNLKHSLHFQNLCSFLNGVTVGGSAALTNTTINNSGSQRQQKQKSSGMSEMENKLTTVICPGCLVCVSSTLTKRDQLIILEVEVRQLQVKILKLLNSLQGSVKEYKTEVNKIEGIVVRSRDNVRNLDNFYCSGTITMEDDERGRDLLKDVIQFREKILTVFEGLRNFSNNLQVFSNSAASLANGHYSAEVDNDTFHDGSIGKRKRSRGQKLVRVVCEEEEANDVDLDDGNHSHDFMVEDGNADEKSTTESLGNDNFADGSPLNPSSANSPRQNSDSERNSDDEDEEKEFLPSRNFISTNGEKTKRNCAIDASPNGAMDNESLLETIDFSNMSTFKKNLICRIINRREKLQKAQTNKSNSKNRRKKKTPEELMFDEIDPRNFCFINYDPSKSNTLSLRDIEITIDEQEESLQCTKCDFKCYQSKGKYPFEFEGAMYNHVVGQHLRLYLCPHCPRDRFPSVKRFRVHILSHNNRYACGKPLANTHCLKQHKWYHMSEQEKAEAVKNGVKSPEETFKNTKEKAEKRHQCSTCEDSLFRPV